MRLLYNYQLPLNFRRFFIALLLVLGIAFNANIFGQCQGFLVTITTDPPNWTLMCAGDDIFVIANVVGGTMPFTYQWSMGGTNAVEAVIAPFTPHNITVTVTDANGCVAFNSFHLKAVFGIVHVNATLYHCNVDVSTLTVNTNSDPNNNSYIWDTGETTQSIQVTGSGPYHVTVTENTLGCIRELEVFPLMQPDPAPTLTGPTTICPGETITISLDIFNLPHQWSIDPNYTYDPSFNVSSPGTYSVTVTDNFLCTGTAAIVVTQLVPVLPQILVPPKICPDGDGVISILNPGDYSSIVWNTGETGTSITATPSQTYSVTVTSMNGCTASQTMNVPPFVTDLPNIIGNNALCLGQNSATITVSPPFVSYQWSTNENTQSITTNVPGDYAVTVTDANGCKTEGTFTVNESSIPEPVIIIPPLYCTNHPVVLQVGGSYGPYISYLWSTGQTAPIIIAQDSSTYSIIVTNLAGCTGSSNAVTIIAQPPPVTSISIASNNCTGTASLTASGIGNYTWSTGDTSNTIVVQQSGDYFLTLTNAAGCSGTAVQNVSVVPMPQVDVSGINTLCNGDSSLLMASAGFLQYNWALGDTSAAITVSQSGVYAVTATDANGCTAVDSLTVTSMPSPQAAIIAPPGFCNGSSATISLDQAFAQMLWSNGDTSQNITVSAANTYTVVVANSFGCSASLAWAIAAYPLPSTAIVGPASICTGNSATIEVSNNFVQVLWSTGDTSFSIIVSQAGLYDVTATDSNGCIATDNHTISVGDSLSPVISIAVPACTTTAILDAGAGYAQYLWSNGATTATISVNAMGNYFVTISDGGGCFGTDIASVSIPALPQVALSGPGFACVGNSGTLSASPGFAAYAWSTGETTVNIAVTQTGSYTVQVTDSNGCTATASQSFQSFPLPAVNISGPSLICQGNSATLQASGNFFQINWSTGATSTSINATQTGVYTVSVTDSNGCSSTSAHTLAISNPVIPVIAVSAPACTGMATLDAGVGYSSYLWSNGGTLPSITVNTTGSYSVTVTDTNGCTGQGTSAVNIPAMPQVSLSGPPSACAGASGSLSASSGFAAYAWSTGATANSISVSQSGNYTVIVTDVNGCTASASQSFQSLPLPVVAISGPVSICTGNTATMQVSGSFPQINWSTGAMGNSISVAQAGQYSVTVSDANGCSASASQGLAIVSSLNPVIAVSAPACTQMASLDAGAGYSNYLWSNGATSVAINVTVSGTFSVTVTDANGCSGSSFSSVNIPALPQVSVSGPASACMGNNSSLVANPGFATYTWSTGATTSNILVSQTGNYSVTVSDVNGCTATAGQSYQALPLPSLSISGPPHFCNGSSATLLATGNFSQITWNTGAMGNSITVTQSGIFSVTVSSANGCTVNAQWSLTQHPTDQTLVQSTVCSLQDTGTHALLLSNQYGCDSLVTYSAMLAPSLSSSVQLSACSGASALFNGTQISAGETKQFVYLAAGGCDSLVTVSVAELPRPDFSLSASPTCWNKTEGEIQISNTLGNGPFLYSLNGSVKQASPAFSQLAGGAHAVLVTDANGCAFERTIQIPQTPPTEVMVEDKELSCAEPMVVLKPIVLSGNAAGIHWQWPDGSTGPTLTVESPGNYGLQTDDGCEERSYNIKVSVAEEQIDHNFFYIPNVFEPNANGANDMFHAFPRPDLNILQFEFRIFDRWGSLLFQTADVTTGWDGIGQDREQQPGVYVWYVRAKIEFCGARILDVFRKGDVTIVR